LNESHWFNTPTIFAFKDIANGLIYRPIAKYDGTNFYEISEGLKRKIENGDI
jgi:hypothetical protein